MEKQIKKLHQKALLLARQSVDDLSAEEKARLDDLMGGDGRYDSLVRLLGDPDFVSGELTAMRQTDAGRASREMKERIARDERGDQGTDAAGRAADRKTGRPSRFSAISSHVLRAAAVVVLLMLGGAVWYHHDYTRVTPPKITEEVELAMKESRESGHMAANVEAITAQHPSPITQEVRQLYHVDDQFAEQLAEAKRITTYQDKEYWVTLDDGTLVHLNNNSRLIYPERFGDRRDVILDGEAYFMVAKDKSRQFVVHTPQGEIRVYGTEFWVKTDYKATAPRANEDAAVGGPAANEAATGQTGETVVALVRGTIGFTPADGREQMLKPGQELTAVNSQLTVTDVDTTPYTAWNTGLFVFENSTLEHLMDVLAQWYDIKKVNYTDDKLRKIHFTGNLKRYGSAERIMKAIMMACDVNIVLQNDTLSVSN